MCYKKDPGTQSFPAEQKITAGSAIPDFGHENISYDRSGR